jgi:hypothetical protein
MAKNDKVKALNTYYDMANAEYDRIHALFDQIDNKVGFLIAVVIGVPIATIGFASQLKAGDLNFIALVLGAIGMLAFLGGGWNILQAIRVRDVKLGIPYDKFSRYSREYEDNAMKEWVADALIESSEFNYKAALKKARYLQMVLPCLIVEVIFLLSGITSVLICKL